MQERLSVYFGQLWEGDLRDNSPPLCYVLGLYSDFELGILTLVFQDPKMVKLTKYTKILICQARSDGSTIKELCTSFGLKRKTIVRILRRKLILPVDNGQLPTDSGKQRILHMKKRLESNPYLTIEQLNLRFPKIFNDCCLERVRKLTSEFYDKFVVK